MPKFTHLVSGHHPSGVEIEGINLNPNTAERCSSASCWIKSELRLIFRASTFLSHSLFFNLPNGDIILSQRIKRWFGIRTQPRIYANMLVPRKGDERISETKCSVWGLVLRACRRTAESWEGRSSFFFISALICLFIHSSIQLLFIDCASRCFGFIILWAYWLNVQHFITERGNFWVTTLQPSLLASWKFCDIL